MILIPQLSSLVLYVKNLPRIAAFYIQHFGFIARVQVHDDLLELRSSDGQCSLLVHQASKGHRVGQSCVKLVFEVDDVEAFKAQALQNGLKFGKTHKGEGYEFSNARDPAQNPIQIARKQDLQWFSYSLIKKLRFLTVVS